MHRRPARTPDPRQVLGPLLSGWWRSDGFVPGAIAAVNDRAVGSAQNMEQATAAKQPTLVDTALRFDGTDDSINATLVGGGFANRALMWMVARAHTLPGAGVHYAGMTYGGLSGHLAPIRMTTTNFTAVLGSSDGTDIIVGPARDSNVHLFEVAFEVTGTGRYVVDGVAFNGSFTGGPAGGTIQSVAMGGFFPPESSNGPFDIYEVGLTNGLPSADQRKALRTYAKRLYRSLSFA